ncbi:MAG TPA: DUF308 domain-containing protein [Amycolatopsis sp.]|nr:DUF308 domain-containing protein [Amycolatopsis sp.]
MTAPGTHPDRGEAAQTPILGGIRTPWWALLVIGVVWLVFGMVVLQFDLVSARSIALAAGLLLILSSFGQVVTAQAARQWRWVHVALAAALFVVGIVALVWPDPTFQALARLLAWFLLIKGSADIVIALVVRTLDALWWIFLVVGLIEIIVALWAAAVPSRSAALLMLWVGLIAVFKGITDIVLAFGLRQPGPPAAPARNA